MSSTLDRPLFPLYTHRTKNRSKSSIQHTAFQTMLWRNNQFAGLCEFEIESIQSKKKKKKEKQNDSLIILIICQPCYFRWMNCGWQYSNWFSMSAQPYRQHHKCTQFCTAHMNEFTVVKCILLWNHTKYVQICWTKLWLYVNK